MARFDWKKITGLKTLPFRKGSMSLESGTTRTSNSSNPGNETKIKTKTKPISEAALKKPYIWLFVGFGSERVAPKKDTERWETRNKSGHRRKKKLYVQEWPNTALANGKTSRETLSSILSFLLVPTLISRSLSLSLSLSILFICTCLCVFVLWVFNEHTLSFSLYFIYMYVFLCCRFLMDKQEKPWIFISCNHRTCLYDLYTIGVRLIFYFELIYLDPDEISASVIVWFHCMW